MLGYLTKAEKELGQIIKTVQEECRKNRNVDNIEELRKLGNVYRTHREVSVMESVYRLCRLNLLISSRKECFVPCDENGTKLIMSLNDLKNRKDDDEIFIPNILDKYRERPLSEEFENICLV